MTRSDGRMQQHHMPKAFDMSKGELKLSVGQWLSLLIEMALHADRSVVRNNRLGILGPM